MLTYVSFHLSEDNMHTITRLYVSLTEYILK